MMDLLSRRAQALVPYVPGEQPHDKQYIKLNTNENPYPPSPKALAAIGGAAGENLRKYSQPEHENLRRLIASNEGLPGEEYVYMGNGSDEVLAFAFAAFLPGQGEAPVLFPDVTYSFYPAYCELWGIPYKTVPLDLNWRILPQDYAVKNGGVVFANPNAPTGQGLAEEEMLDILRANPRVLVLVDEAYVMFGGVSMAKHIKDYPNLLVVRTLSKSHALAGLRVGYALGQPDLIDGIRRVKNSFNSYPLDSLAIAGAEAAIADGAYVREICGRVTATREWFVAQLSELGFETVPSQTNFIFTQHEKHSGISLASALKDKGVLVRRFARPEKIAGWLRMSIGTQEEMEIVVKVLRELVEA